MNDKIILIKKLKCLKCGLEWVPKVDVNIGDEIIHICKEKHE